MADATATTRNVDFTDVKEGGGKFNTRRLPAGDYLAKIIACEDAEVKSGDNQGEFQYVWTIAPLDHLGHKYPHRTPLVPNQLWKLRNLLVAAGLAVPQRKLKVVPSRVVNKVIGITLEDDEYQGKPKSQIASVFPATELANQTVKDDDEDEEVYTGPDDDLDDTEDEDAGDEFDGMDRAELKSWIKARDSAAVFRKSESDDDLRTRARALGVEDEEEEDEEEPPPPPKKTVKKVVAKKAAKKAPAPPPDDDDEDLDTLDLDDEL